VAYEGYDTIHDCNSPPIKRTQTNGQKEAPEEKKLGYEDLGFIKVDVPSGAGEEIKRRESQQVQPPKKGEKPFRQPVSTKPPVFYPSGAGTRKGIPGWVWIIIIVFILWLIVRR